jgi:hypothetical protein
MGYRFLFDSLRPPIDLSGFSSTKSVKFTTSNYRLRTKTGEINRKGTSFLGRADDLKLHRSLSVWNGTGGHLWRFPCTGFPRILEEGIFGIVLWLFGDKLIVPLLGLQKGPTSVTLVDHSNRLSAHLAYGFSTAMVFRLLNKIL